MIEFLPAKWWQAQAFIKLTFDVIRDIDDPRVNQFLTLPWPRRMLEYGYMADNFFRSDSYFIYINNQRAGVVSMIPYPEVLYVEAIGLLPDFRGNAYGRSILRFIFEQAGKNNVRALATTTHKANTPINRLVKLSKGHPLGLSTTTLDFDVSLKPNEVVDPHLVVKPLNKQQAKQAWQYWRLHEVEQVAVPEAQAIAQRLIEWDSLPKGTYLSLHDNGRQPGDQEIGFALATPDNTVSLWPHADWWSDEKTIILIKAIMTYLQWPSVQKITLTQTHADALDADALGFVRDKMQERKLSFKLLN